MFIYNEPQEDGRKTKCKVSFWLEDADVFLSFSIPDHEKNKGLAPFVEAIKIIQRGENQNTEEHSRAWVQTLNLEKATKEAWGYLMDLYGVSFQELICSISLEKASK